MRLLSRLGPPAAIAAVAATAAIGLGVTAAPASAEPHDPCATATAIFQARMNQAGALLEAADRLADAGYEQEAQAAANRADFYLNLAEESLSNMSAWC